MACLIFVNGIKPIRRSGLHDNPIVFIAFEESLLDSPVVKLNTTLHVYPQLRLQSVLAALEE